MKQEQFPDFVQQSDQGKVIHAQAFVSFYANINDPQFIKRHLKRIQECIYHLNKSSTNDEIAFDMVKIICSQFKQTQSPQLIILLKSVLSSDKKYESLKQNTQNKMMQENVRCIDSNTVIALPYQAPIGPVMISHGAEQMSDVSAQQQLSQAKIYYKQDDQKITQYINNPFRTVKREGISDFFTKSAEYIATQLIQNFLSKRIDNIQPVMMLKILTLLDFISAPLYTFYLVNLGRTLSEQLLILFDQKQNQKKMSRQQVQELFIKYNSISQRWSDNPQSNHQFWQWQAAQKVIILFIHSEISQKKLFAVQQICQLCRRFQYFASRIGENQLRDFIASNGLLEAIYRADNHPQIITKGSEVFQFMCKNGQLNQQLVNLIFSLLQKCHDHISRSLFSLLQGTGHTNLEKNRQLLLHKILQLPRPSCFNQQTFSLIETLMVLTPPAQTQSSLTLLYDIMQKNYEKLKQKLKQRSVMIYFQVFIMGLESGIFTHQEHSMLTLRPILHNPSSNLFILMIQTFVVRLREQYSRSVGPKCKKTLNNAIRNLILEQKIHKFSAIMPENQQKHLKILKLLLQNYQEIDHLLLSSQQLWQLVKVDDSFTKFIKFYPQQTQTELISSLIANQQKNTHDMQCIIDLYDIVNSHVKASISNLLIEQFFNNSSLICKYMLAPLLIKFEKFTLQQAINKLSQPLTPKNALSWIVMTKQLISSEDEKGFGKYPPLQYLRNSQDICVKICNYCSEDPKIKDIIVKNYVCLSELIFKALQVNDLSLDKVKIRLNDKYISLNQFKNKLSSVTNYKSISLEMYTSEGSSWFSSQNLFDKDGAFTTQVKDMLKQIFHRHSAKKGRLQARQVADIFQKAIQQNFIDEKDSRITHIFTTYSNQGEYLSMQEWINFYYQSALNNAPLVIQNLKNLGYEQSFKGQQSFLTLMSSQNRMRQSIVKDNTLYQNLFKMYQVFQNKQDDQSKWIVSELMSILRLLPLNQQYFDQIQQNRQTLFRHNKNNHLYYWYVASLLQFVSLGYLPVDQSKKWTQKFTQSQNYNCFVKVFETILNSIQNKEIQKQHINSNIQMLILIQLGKVLRKSLTNIPFLLDLNLIKPISSSLRAVDQIKIDENNNFELNLQRFGKLCQIFDQEQKETVENLAAIVLFGLIQAIKKSKCQIFVDLELIFHKSLHIRIIFNSFYFFISQLRPHIKHQYYSVELQLLNQGYPYCQQYFNVLSQFILFQENQGAYQAVSAIYQQNITTLASFNQKFVNDANPLLLGQLRILNDIKTLNPKTQITSQAINAIQLLLQNQSCQQIRTVLYSLSENLCPVSYNLKMIGRVIQNIKLTRNSADRSGKQVGIMNLGCTCYINAVLQQLQKVQPFRRGIISTQVATQDVDFFTQFQSLFYQLTFGRRSFIIPQNFCLNYLDHSGKPIDTKQQHDADQFLNQLLDRLEFRLKNTSQHNLINDNFKGQMLNIISCDECYYQKQKVQNFYILSLQIKNQNNLKDCLQKLIEPQIITDYYCDQCQKKVQSIQKYHRLNSLPKFLVIHLQRLVFDMQAFIKIKLDHPVDFPMELDLNKYFNKQMQRSQYVLKGFVVHVGNSEGGHYYSIIKCDSEWIKFDDTRVDKWIWEHGSHEKNNAYMLIYQLQSLQSQNKNDYISGNQFLMKKIEEDTINFYKQKIFLQPSFTAFLLKTLQKIVIPTEFISEINNFALPYQHNYMQLPQQIQEQLNIVFYVILKYLSLSSDIRQLNIMVTNNDAQMKDDNQVNRQQFRPIQDHQIQQIVTFFVGILHYRPQISSIIVQQYCMQGQKNLLKIIYTHRDQLIRKSFVLILNKIFAIQASRHQFGFVVPIPQNQIINKLLNTIILGLTEVGKNPTKMAQYFELIIHLCRQDPRFTKWFQLNKLGPRLIHFFMQKQSILEEFFPIYPLYTGTQYKIQVMQFVFQIINLMLPLQSNLYIESEQLKIQKKAYLNINFYQKILSNRYQNSCLSNIFSFGAKNCPVLNQKLLLNILQSLNRFNHEDSYIFTYINIAYSLLKIQDNYQNMRMERLLGVPVLMRCGQKEGEEYLTVRPTDRRCRYQNPLFLSDEIFMSMLEFLFSNKAQVNYFVFLSIIALLTLMSENIGVFRHIMSLPGPTSQYTSYFDWINDFLLTVNDRLKQDGYRYISVQNKNLFLQQIVQMQRKIQNNQQKQEFQQAIDFQQKKQTNQLFNIGLISYYSDWIQLPFILGQNLQIRPEDHQKIKNFQMDQVIACKYRVGCSWNIQQDRQNPRVIEYQIQSSCRYKLWFSQTYPYQLICGKRLFQLALPYHHNQVGALKVNILQVIQVQQKQQSPKKYQQMPMQVEPKLNMNDFPTINDVYSQQMAGQVAPQLFGDLSSAQAQNQSTYQCPFCCHVSTTFSSRCANCGEQLGELNW